MKTNSLSHVEMLFVVTGFIRGLCTDLKAVTDECMDGEDQDQSRHESVIKDVQWKEDILIVKSSVSFADHRCPTLPSRISNLNTVTHQQPKI